MTTFFENQIEAKRRTKILVLLYILAIVAIVFGIYFGLVITFFAANNEDAEPVLFDLWQPDLFCVTAIVILLMILFASIFKIMQLRSGGSLIATMLGGRLINPSTIDPLEKRLLNIVEEMAIASGLNVPPVFLMEKEKSINAFAAGFTPSTAVIGVSRGCLELLNRDELQGVVAHEFSHILNGDMALNIKLIGILHGIIFLALTGRTMVRIGSRSSGRKNAGGGVAMIGLILMVVGYIGVFFATLIKMAVSRQREFLADASAVQFTRQPEGISGALKKIGALYDGSKIKHHNAEEASHMFFADGLRQSFSSWMSTHPPLKDRIKEIDPYFDGNFPEYSYEELAQKSSISPKQKEAKKQTKRGPLDPLDPIIPDALEPAIENTFGQVLGSIGTLSILGLEASKNFVSNLPNKIYTAAHEPYSARFLIYFVLLDHDNTIQEKQVKLLKENLSEAEFEDFSRLLPLADRTTIDNYLSLLDLCFPSLALLTKEQFFSLRKNCIALIQIDDDINIYEYTLYTLLSRHYDKVFHPEKLKPKTLPGQKINQAVSDMLIALAVLGNKDNMEEASAAYSKAIFTYSLPDKFAYKFESLPEINFQFLDKAMESLMNTNFKQREAILAAAIVCVGSDKTLTKEEYALIRAIAANFDCPVPL